MRHNAPVRFEKQGEKVMGLPFTGMKYDRQRIEQEWRDYYWDEIAKIRRKLDRMAAARLLEAE